MKKFNLKNIIIYICFFLLLLYPFNSSIMDLIYPSSLMLLLSVGIPIFILFLLMCRKLNKKVVLITSVILIIMLIVFINNKNIYYGNYASTLLFFMYLLLIVLLYLNSDWLEQFFNTLNIFLIAHVIITLFAVVFKDIYRTKIIPLICKGVTSCVAAGNYYNGYIPGFTRHFSTNGIYMSIAVLYSFSRLINVRTKKNVFYFLVSLLALFVVGKRAHLIFSIIACILLYLFNSRKSSASKIIKIIFISIILFFLLSVFSNYIPEINNIFIRFSSLIESGNVLNGRENLFDSAIRLWQNKPFFGNGWGYFRYYYHFNLYQYGDVAYVDVHNVYLQLLCEVGIFGFLVFLLLFIYNIYVAIYNIRNIDKIPQNYHMAVNFSLVYQLFFLLYCLTGNPLYDVPTYTIYFISISISLMINSNLKKEVLKNEKNRNNNLS